MIFVRMGNNNGINIIQIESVIGHMQIRVRLGKSINNLSSIIAWDRVLMFLPPAFFARLQASQSQKSDGQPSAAAVPKY